VCIYICVILCVMMTACEFLCAVLVLQEFVNVIECTDVSEGECWCKCALYVYPKNHHLVSMDSTNPQHLYRFCGSCVRGYKLASIAECFMYNILFFSTW